jgi:hypothetical protein
MNRQNRISFRKNDASEFCDPCERKSTKIISVLATSDPQRHPMETADADTKAGDNWISGK